ncbi:MAG TPA: R2-like ligand-binding oxidase [Gaiellaceae bacterium]|nr:R2-like ligand-binding oxidase [Gaiellaceae bacterium]
MAVHEGFRTTSGGLRDCFPLRLYHKAKRLGAWDPAAVDLTQDRRDWESLDDLQRETILSLTSLFAAGEEAVTLDLLPLVLAVARDGRVEEELYLTTFLYEEAKHTELFARFLDEVMGAPDDLQRFHVPAYRKLFYEELPAAMERLLADPSPEALARASVTYNMIVEGVLAETGYHSYHESLAANGLMPGLCSALVDVKRDESRHVAYGVYLLGRLVAEEPSTWDAIEARMQELFPYALGVVTETFARYEDGVTPFGLDEETFTTYAQGQFAKRYDRIARSRGRTLAEVEAIVEEGEP